MAVIVAVIALLVWKRKIKKIDANGISKGTEMAGGTESPLSKSEEAEKEGFDKL